MVALVIGISLAVVIGLGMLLFLSDPKYKTLNAEKEALRVEIGNLKREIAKKDKELSNLRPWVPWYVTVEKETDGPQE